MWGYYLALFASALIFSSQFLITRQYQRRNGTGFLSSVRLSLFAYLTIALFFLTKGSITYKAFNFGFSVFTFAVTLAVGVVSLCCAYMGMKVLAVGDMGIYSVFMMLGSLVLPSVTGIAFFGEKLTLLKIIALLCMIVAIVFSVSGPDKKKFSGKAFFYYIGIFVLNGLIGVFFTIHQNKPELTAAALRLEDGAYAINNDVFMTWYGLSTALLCIAVYAVVGIVRLAVKKSHTKEISSMENRAQESAGTTEIAARKNSVVSVWLVSVGLAVVYGICNGLGDYFIALGTQPGALGSSVSFPIVNGGTILFSTLNGLIFYKEKIHANMIVSLILVFVSTILFLFV